MLFRSTFRTVLPPSIQELHISRPYLSIVEQLEEITFFPDSFPNLHTITLWPREYRGDGYESFVYWKYPIWEALEQLGFTVNIFYDEAEYLADWDDEDYDPFVVNIVVWLKGLWHCVARR